MTALYFAHLRGPDRVSVKPHAVAGPARDQLPARTAGRGVPHAAAAFGGLQSYPSRSKDPDPVDFSTGSRRDRCDGNAVERARAPLRRRSFRRAAGRASGRAARRCRAGRGGDLGGAGRPDGAASGRGAVGRRPQPPVAGPGRAGHRRGADRVDVRGGGLADDHGEVRPALARAVRARRRRGAAQAHRRDGQRGVPALAAPAAARAARAACRARGAAVAPSPSCSSDLEDAEVAAAVRDLGGHDLQDLLEAFREADAATDRPSVVFAYTIKAWSLPTQGHPANHSALLTRRAVGAARRASSAPMPQTRGRCSPTASAEAALCRETARAAGARGAPAATAAGGGRRLGREHRGAASTQQAFGRFFVDLAHAAPEVAEHVVTVSPDVASSTNLGGWINRAGICQHRRSHRLVRRRHRDADPLARVRARAAHRARHRRGQPRRRCWASSARRGRATASRCCRSARSTTRSSTARSEPWSFGMYAGGQSILVGTPSGVTLAPGGRRAPVDHHAVGRHRAAALRRLGAGLRPGPRVDAAARARPPRPAGRGVRLLPPLDAADRSGARRRSRMTRRTRARAARRPRRRLRPARRRGRAAR